MGTAKTARVSIRTLGILLAVSVVITPICQGLCLNLPFNQRIYFVVPAVAFPLVWGIFLFFFGVVVIHELGHIAFGKLSGLTFDSVQIGRLRWQRIKGKIKFSETDYPWFDGLTSMRMPKNRRQRWRYFIFVLGGAIPMICVGLWFVNWVAGAMTPAQADRGALIAAILFTAIFTLAPFVPYRQGANYSDGHHLISMLRDWPRYERHLAAHNLAIDLRDDLDLDEEELTLAASVPADKHSYGIALYCRYYQRLEERDNEGAKAQLETLLAGIPPTLGVYYVVRAHAAFFHGYFEKNATRAQDFLSSIMAEQFPTSYAYLLAVAGTRYAQGRWPEARSAATEILDACEGRFNDSPSLIEAEALRAIREESIQKSAAAVVASPV